MFVYLLVARVVCHLLHEGIDEQQMWSRPRGQGVDCNLSHSLYSKLLKWAFRKAFPAENLSELISARQLNKSSDFWLVEYNTILI